MQVVGINYLEASPESFCPRADTPPPTSKVEINSSQKAPTIEKNVSRSTDSEEISIAEDIKPAVSRPVIRQQRTLPVSTVNDSVASLPEEVIEKETPVQTIPDHEVTMKEPLPVGQDIRLENKIPLQDSIIQTPQQAFGVLEPEVGVEPFLSEGTKTQVNITTDNQKSGRSLSDQKDKTSDRKFREALPRYDVNPPPHYPQVAKLRGWEGKVVFEALIRKNGRVDRLKIKDSSGYRSLDTAARKAISRWKFYPATSFGFPKDSEVEIPITFSLKDS